VTEGVVAEADLGPLLSEAGVPPWLALQVPHLRDIGQLSVDYTDPATPTAQPPAAA
jgi:hypothetical protein